MSLLQKGSSDSHLGVLFDGKLPNAGRHRSFTSWLTAYTPLPPQTETFSASSCGMPFWLGPAICFELYLPSNPFCTKERKLASLNKLRAECSPLLPSRLALPSHQFKHFPCRTPQVRGRDQSPCLSRSPG